MEENEYAVSIEELHERKAVKRVKSQAIGPSHDQNNKKAAADSLKEKLKTLLMEEQRDNSTTTPQQPKIQRVVPMLRDKKNFEKHYEPRAVSIGPIHHGKPRLQIAEKYKPKLVRKFIQDSSTHGEVLFMKVLEDINELRNCYEEEVTASYEDEDLAWMFFLDGCSTLQFIHSFKMGRELKQYFNIKKDQIAFAQQDLFLLENQLPYRLLKLLMNSTESNCNKYEESIKFFIGSTSTAPEKLRQKIIKDMDGKPEPAHLLDVLQSALLSQPREKKDDDDKRGENYRGQKKEENYRRQSFRNIQELKEAGIQFKPSSSSSLRDIDFDSSCFAGYLKLPPLTVDDSTEPLLLNLIAYEMCPDNSKTDYGVTSYVCFLDELIDSAEDVKDLRSANILQNSLGSDAEVAKLFNDIGTDLVPNPEAYTNVKDRIQKHYENKWMTWIAQGYYNHFSTPWTILASTAALIALALSSVQTWMAVCSWRSAGPCDELCKNFTMHHKP